VETERLKNENYDRVCQKINKPHHWLLLIADIEIVKYQGKIILEPFLVDEHKRFKNACIDFNSPLMVPFRVGLDKVKRISLRERISKCFWITSYVSKNKIGSHCFEKYDIFVLINLHLDGSNLCSIEPVVGSTIDQINLSFSHFDFNVEKHQAIIHLLIFFDLKETSTKLKAFSVAIFLIDSIGFF
jgi:hypothetical protein